MPEKELVRQKLTKMVTNLNQLKEIEDYSLEEYLDNFFLSRTTERLIQLLVETATDINGHILVTDFQKSPDSYFESFIQLGEVGVISRELAKELAPSAGIRNRLVHEYDEIDDKIIYESVSDAIDLFQKYINSINCYL